ncbi:MAG: Uma2 family endonuclease [Planctomycetes bacterium]|nr:Uma2 family endonuclease [Planctomycetota bacterium]
MATAFEPEVVPLNPGDKLSRAEFLRRWEAHPEIKNAELFGGIVYMASPVSVQHGDSDGQLGGLFFVYSAATPGTATGHNTTTFILDDVAQPDLNLRILPEYGGGSCLDDKYLRGVPELLAEITRSSVALDMHVKLELYQEANIPEYLAVLLHEKEIRWHVLVDGTYQRLSPDADGIWRSRIFPGLWLDGQAFFDGNMNRVLARLQEGLASAEHQAFVAELNRRRQAR